MMIKNNHKTNEKKKLRKVKKHWIIVASLISLATVGTYSIVETQANASVIIQNQVNVSDGDELVAALSNVDINQINFSQNISFDSTKHGFEFPFYKGSRVVVASRDLTINLNGHQLNFNDAKFNFKKTNIGNQITINNGQLLSDGSSPIFLSDDLDLQLTINLKQVDHGKVQLISPDDTRLQINSDESIPDANATNPDSSANNNDGTMPNDSSHSTGESTNEVIDSSAAQSANDSSSNENVTSSSHSVESSNNSSQATSSSSAANSTAANPNHSISSAPSSFKGSSNINLIAPAASDSFNNHSIFSNNNSSMTNQVSNVSTNDNLSSHSVAILADKNEEVNHDSATVDGILTNHSIDRTVTPERNSKNNSQKHSKVKYIQIKNKRDAKKIKVYKKVNLKTNQMKLRKKLVANKKYRVLTVISDKHSKPVYQTSLGYVFDNKRLIKIK